VSQEHRPTNRDQGTIDALDSEVGEVARAFAGGSISLLVAARRLASLRHELGVAINDQDFAIFVAIDSETDHLPNDLARPHCTEAWLKQCDQELAELEAFHRVALNLATQGLIQRFPTRRTL
jgi:hypothetical protein